MMKINGKKISSANIEYIVIPRGDGNNIIFKAQAVLDSTPFEKLCPLPTPPKLRKKGGVVVDDVEDVNYRKALVDYARLKSSWIFLQSLRATENLEWELVDYSDPATWNNYHKDLVDSGFSEQEIIMILNGVMTANALNQAKIDEARERFFIEVQQVQSIPSSPQDDQNTTPSGEPAKDSD